MFLKITFTITGRSLTITVNAEYYFFFSNFLSGPLPVDSTFIFTLHDDDDADWNTAKSRCETLGQRLAVLDTEEKRDALQAQM